MSTSYLWFHKLTPREQGTLGTLRKLRKLMFELFLFKNPHEMLSFDVVIYVLYTTGIFLINRTQKTMFPLSCSEHLCTKPRVETVGTCDHALIKFVFVDLAVSRWYKRMTAQRPWVGWHCLVKTSKPCKKGGRVSQLILPRIMALIIIIKRFPSGICLRSWLFAWAPPCIHTQAQTLKTETV